jgi:hypothetical protein
METRKYSIETKNKLHFEFLKSEQEVNTTIKKIYSIRGVNQETNSNKKTDTKAKSLSALPFITPRQLSYPFHIDEKKSTIQPVVQVKSTTTLSNQVDNADLPKINKYIVKTDTSNLDENNWKRFFSRRKNIKASSMTVEEIDKNFENTNIENKISDDNEQNFQDEQNETNEDKNINFLPPSSAISSSNQKDKNKFKIKFRKPRNLQKLYRLL